MTTPTTNHVPSNSPQDLLFNAETLDEVVNSSALTYTDRLGVVRKTIPGIIRDASVGNTRGAWSGPGTVYALNDAALFSGTWYLCVVPHTSSAAFATDAAKWRVHQGVQAVDLEDDTSPTLGAGLVGYNPDLNYPADSIGALGAAKPDNLADVALDLIAGTPVVIDCHGDSTMYGYVASEPASTAPITPSQALQDTLRRYYGNSAATVNNRALSGTTLAQMLAGTDGSGSTFAAKMASSTAAVVYCNHGINDATVSTPTLPVDFKADLIQFVRLVRKAGKTPVLVTPNPQYPIVGRALNRSELIKQYAGVTRQVAAEYGVALVDQNLLVEGYLASGAYQADQVVYDGIHPSIALAEQTGRNLAIPLVAQLRPFTAGEQFQSAADAAVMLTNGVGTDVAASRFGLTLENSGSGAASIRILALVTQPGLDLHIATPLRDDYPSIVVCNRDSDANISSWSLQTSGFPSSGAFPHDYETCFWENVPVGLHIVEMTASGPMGIQYLRSRARAKPSVFKTSGGTGRVKKLIADSFVHDSVAADTYILFDEPITSHLTRYCEIEWVAQMPKQTGVVLSGFLQMTDSGTATPRPGLLVNLNLSGFLAVYEASGPGTVSSVTLGAVDLSVASHRYRAVLTTGRFGSLQVYVDDTLIGSYTITQPFWGGRLGTWKFQPSSSFTLDRLCVSVTV